MTEANKPRGYANCLNLKYDSTDEEIKRLYDAWAPLYEQDTSRRGYVGAKIALERLLDIFKQKDYSKSTRILDIGAGTGLCAEILRKEGYTNIDAVDISPEMLELAKERKLYKNYFCESIGSGTLSIKENEYDVVVALGCIARGHIRAQGLEELAFVTKPGGLIVFSIRCDYYVDPTSGYAAKVKELQERNSWVVTESKTIDYHLNAFDYANARHCELLICKKV